MICYLVLVWIIVHSSCVTIYTSQFQPFKFQAGTANVILSNLSSSSSADVKFSIVFQQNYDNLPRVVTSINFLKFCKQQLSYQFNSMINSFVTNTDASITSRLSKIKYDSSNSTTNYQLKINYFVYNQNNKGIVIKICTLTGTHLKQSINFERGGVTNNQNALIAVIYHVFSQQQRNMSQHFYESSVKLVDNITAQINLSVDNCDTCFFKFNVIMIYDDSSILLYQGIISKTQFYSNPLNSSTTFFTGIRQNFISYQQCQIFGLGNDNRQIDTRTNTYTTLLSYFLIVKKNLNTTFSEPSLSLIISELFYLKINFKFENFSNQLQLITHPSNIIKSSVLELFAFIKPKGQLQTFVKQAITSNQIMIDFSCSNFVASYHTKFSINIFWAFTLCIKSFDNLAYLEIINLPSTTTKTDLAISNSNITIEKLQHLSGGLTMVNLKYNKQTTGQTFQVEFQDQSVKSKFQIYIPTVTMFRTQTNAPHCMMDLKDFINPKPFLLFLIQFAWKSDFIKKTTSSFSQSGFGYRVSFEYINVLQAEKDRLQFNLKFNSEFKMLFDVKIITVQSIETEQGVSIIKMYFINIPNPKNVIKSQIELNSSLELKIENVSYDEDLVVVQIDATNYTEGKYFSALYKPTDSSYIAQTGNINFYFVFLYQYIFSQEQNSLIFVISNPENLTEKSKLDISFNNNKITIKNTSFTQQNMTFFCQINGTIQKFKLKLFLDKDNKTIFKQTITVPLNSTMKYCPISDSQSRKIYWILSIVISVLYIIVFILSFVAIRKLYGIQLMFLINLAFFSLIPLDPYCSPLNGLKGLKYSSSMTQFFNSNQQQILSNYSSLGIQPNFILNANILLLPILFLPLLYFPLNKKGLKSQDCHKRPQYLTYGKAMLCQVPLTLLLFNAFNICVSTVITFQYFQLSSTLSKIISIISILLLPASAILFCIFKQHFSQFKDQFNICDPFASLTRQTTVLIRRCYPIILIVQFTLVPIILSIRSLFQINLFIILSLEILITIFILVIPLYLKKIMNFRNILHRVIVLLILSLQITYQQFHDNPSAISFVRWYPLMLLLLLFFGAIITGGFTVYKCIQFWKGPDLYDVKYNKSDTKPVDYVPKPQGTAYPKNPHNFTASFLNKKKLVLQRNKFQKNTKIQKWFYQVSNIRMCYSLGVDGKAYNELKNKLPTLDQKQAFLRKYIFLQSFDQILASKKVSSLEECLLLDQQIKTSRMNKSNIPLLN